MDRNQPFDRDLDEYLERNYDKNAKFISSSINASDFLIFLITARWFKTLVCYLWNRGSNLGRHILIFLISYYIVTSYFL